VEAALANGHGEPGTIALTAPRVVRVVIADRHRLYLESLELAIADAEDIEIAAAVTSGFAVLEAIREHQVDVVLADVDLPDLDANGILNAIEREGHGARCVFLAHHPDAKKAYDALELGARGYIARTADREEIREAIRSAVDDDGGFAVEIHTALVRELRRRALPGHSPLDDGTREVLLLTAAGMSPSQVAKELKLAVPTVKGRLHALYKRLGVSAATAAVAEAIRQRLIG
jgi:DNA-binding NarL/FixJ family response regulator